MFGRQPASKIMKSQTDLIFDPQLIRKFDINGPRYTSYPTADRFVEAFNAEALRAWLAKRAVGGVSKPLSLYFHIPFCNTICYYCACNKIITKDHGRSAKYLKYLAKEIEMQAACLEGSRQVTQLHLGGGTPTFLSHDEMRELMAAVREHFTLVPNGEYSIEVDPRKVDFDTVKLLAELGFNRMSVGVQDFAEDVQQAVNRIQSFDETKLVIDAARANGFKSVSMDLIYGLPRQNPTSFDRTLDQVLEISPDRISLYSYAHLPGLFKPQRRINSGDMPTADTKLALLQLGIRRLPGARLADGAQVVVVLVEDHHLAAHRVGHVLGAVRLDADVDRLGELAWTDRAGHGREALLLQVQDDHRGVGVADVDLAVVHGDAVGLVELEVELLADHEAVETALLLDVLEAVEGGQELQARERRRRREVDRRLALESRCCTARGQERNQGEDQQRSVRQNRAAASSARELRGCRHRSVPGAGD